MFDARHVLVVDDEDGICDLLKVALEDASFTVNCAPTAEDALSFLKTNPVDLVLLDAILPPPMDALDVAREAIHSGAAVLFMTGDHALASGIEHDGCGVIRKPFRLSSLIQDARHTIAASRDNRERMAQSVKQLIERRQTLAGTVGRVKKGLAAR